MGVAESREEYLEAVFKLSASGRGATVGRLAKELEVRPASASEMVGRLLADGLLERDEHNRSRVVLTEAGRARAVRVVRRHRLSERLLTDYLGLPWDEVHQEACRLEHALSDAVEVSLAERLGHPRTCPHGRPIPYEGDVAALDFRPCEASRTLADLKLGEGGTISHVSEEDPELLRFLASMGLIPEAPVVVAEIAPFDGPLTIAVGGLRHAVGCELARKVFVWSDDERCARSG